MQKKIRGFSVRCESCAGTGQLYIVDLYFDWCKRKRGIRQAVHRKLLTKISCIFADLFGKYRSWQFKCQTSDGNDSVRLQFNRLENRNNRSISKESRFGRSRCTNEPLEPNRTAVPNPAARKHQTAFFFVYHFPLKRTSRFPATKN